MAPAGQAHVAQTRACLPSHARGAAPSRVRRAAAPRTGGTATARRPPAPGGRSRSHRGDADRRRGRVAKPLSRSTLSCIDTAGCPIPNSSEITSTTSPDDRSPAASSSRIRRRTGSPSTSKACISPSPPRAGGRCTPRCSAPRRRSPAPGRCPRRHRPRPRPCRRRARRRSSPGPCSRGRGGVPPGRRGAAEARRAAISQPMPTAPGPNSCGDGLVDGRGVLEAEPGARAVLGERDHHPGDAAAELPGDLEQLRLLAALHRAAGIALELVAAAEHQVARHRCDPARDAVGGGHGVPDLGPRGVVVLLDDEHPHLLAVAGVDAQAAVELPEAGPYISVH